MTRKKGKDPRPVMERMNVRWRFDDGDMTQTYTDFAEQTKSAAEKAIESDEPSVRRIGVKALTEWDDKCGGARATREYSKMTGGQGGAAPKRRAWAEALAKMLVDMAPGTEQKAWLKIQESANPREVETDDATFQVYRDGNKIIAVDDTTGREQNLTKSVFFRNYYRKAKNTR